MSERNSISTLRAHHGLCINFFEGKGYSDKFSNNMEKIIALLENDPVITIIKERDNVCLHCPFNENDVCASLEKVNRYDNAVLDICNISSGDTMKWSEYRTLISKNILEENKLKDICPDCCWYKICSEKMKFILQSDNMLVL